MVSIPSGDITISGWIYPTSYGEGGAGYIFSNGKLVLFFNGRFYLDRDGVGHSFSNEFTDFPRWYHVVWLSRSDGTTTFYIDGINCTYDSSAGTPESAYDYTIGTNGGNNTFQGIIEGLSIVKGIWPPETVLLDFSVSK